MHYSFKFFILFRYYIFSFLLFPLLAFSQSYAFNHDIMSRSYRLIIIDASHGATCQIVCQHHIQFLAVDYKKRASVFGPVIQPSDDIEVDMKKIQIYFKDVIPKTRENFAGEYF